MMMIMIAVCRETFKLNHVPTIAPAASPRHAAARAGWRSVMGLLADGPDTGHERREV